MTSQAECGCVGSFICRCQDVNTTHLHIFPADGKVCPFSDMAAQNSSSVPARRSYDDPHSIACLVLFLLAAFVTIRPIVIPVYIPDIVGRALYHLRLRDTAKPLKRHTYHLSIDLNVGPIAAVLVLLASKSIGIVEFRAGIKGVGDLHPYDILLLFLSLVLSYRCPCLRREINIISGLHSYFPRLDWRIAFPRLLGCQEGRVVGAQASFLSLSLLPCPRWRGGKCEYE